MEADTEKPLDLRWMSRNFLETAIFQIKERKQRQKFWKHGEIVILWGTHKSKEMLQAFLVHMFQAKKLLERADGLIKIQMGQIRKRKRKAKSRSFLFQKRKVKAGAPKGDKGCTGRKFCKEGRKKSGFFLFCFGNPQSGNPTSIFREEAASIRREAFFLA